MIQLDPTVGTLEHHGIKGMRWGVRKDTESSSSSDKRHLSSNQKKAIGITAAVGAAALTLALKSHGDKKFTSVAIPNLIYTDRQGQKIYDYSTGISRMARVRISDLPKHNAQSFFGV